VTGCWPAARQLTGAAAGDEVFPGGRRGQLQAALARYTAAMARHHRHNQIIHATGGGR
jgi:hypothetical protein